jgi:hypothetical protein
VVGVIPDPELLAAASSVRLRASRFDPEPMEIPAVIAARLKDFTDFAAARLGLAPTPQVRFFRPRGVDVHSGVWFRAEETAWIAAEHDLGCQRPAREMAITIGHELTHAAGITDEETCQLNGLALVREYERIAPPASVTTPAQAPQFFGGF